MFNKQRVQYRTKVKSVLTSFETSNPKEQVHEVFQDLGEDTPQSCLEEQVKPELRHLVFPLSVYLVELPSRTLTLVQIPFRQIG